MIKKGRTEKQAESYWDRKQESAAESEGGSNDSSVSSGLAPELIETSKADLLNVKINTMQPDPSRVKLQGGSLVADPIIKNKAGEILNPPRAKGFRQIGTGTPEIKPERSTFVQTLGRPSMLPSAVERIAYGVTIAMIALISIALIWLSGDIGSLPAISLGGALLGYKVYGPERILPDDVDFVWYSNENLGFTAALADGTNHVFAYSMPYPAGMNLFSETIDIYRIDFMVRDTLGEAALVFLTEDWYLSMLDKEFNADWTGTFVDTEDENLKAHFDGPISMGVEWANVVGSGATVGYTQALGAGKTQVVHYYPPVRKLNAVTPLFIQFAGFTTTITLSTGATATTNTFARHENVANRMFFKVRNLTATERSIRSDQLRWQLLNS